VVGYSHYCHTRSHVGISSLFAILGTYLDLLCFQEKRTRIMEVLAPNNYYGIKAVLFGSLYPQDYYVPHSNEMGQILSLFSTIPRLIALILLVGFWFDIILSEMRPKLSIRTKITLVILSILLFILEFVGYYFTFAAASLYELGAIFLVVPIGVTSIGLSILIGFIGCCAPSPAVPNSEYDEKKKYMLKYSSLGVSVWFAHIIMLCLVLLRIPEVSLFSFASFPATSFFAISINFWLVDREGGAFFLFSWFFDGKLSNEK